MHLTIIRHYQRQKKGRAQSGPAGEGTKVYWLKIQLKAELKLSRIERGG